MNNYSLRTSRAYNNQCVSCGKNIGIYLEFGGNSEIKPVSIDGDGFTCSNRCANNLRNEISKEMDIEFGTCKL